MRIEVLFYNFNCQVIEIVVEARAMRSFHKAEWSALIIHKLRFEGIQNGATYLSENWRIFIHKLYN